MARERADTGRRLASRNKKHSCSYSRSKKEEKTQRDSLRDKKVSMESEMNSKLNERLNKRADEWVKKSKLYGWRKEERAERRRVKMAMRQDYGEGFLYGKSM